MRDTVLLWTGKYLGTLFPLARQPAGDGARSASAPDRDDVRLEPESRFSRDEACYWGMHAHW